MSTLYNVFDRVFARARFLRIALYRCKEVIFFSPLMASNIQKASLNIAARKIRDFCVV
jgi:hypothetical protein